MLSYPIGEFPTAPPNQQQNFFTPACCLKQIYLPLDASVKSFLLKYILILRRFTFISLAAPVLVLKKPLQILPIN